MRKMNYLLVIGFVLLIPTILFAQPKVGDQVAAKWTDGNYYLASITNIEGDQISVDYKDGDKGVIKMADIIAIPAKQDIKVGDKVLAVWSTARFYTGVVVEVTPTAYSVKWDDGSAPSPVSPDRIIKQ